jgi:hypothetical protein
MTVQQDIFKILLLSLIFYYFGISKGRPRRAETCFQRHAPCAGDAFPWIGGTSGTPRQEFITTCDILNNKLELYIYSLNTGCGA